MPADTFFALLLFAGVMVSTPGPANMVLLASGVRFGFRRSLAFLCGVTLGKQFNNIALALGLWKVVTTFPEVLLVMKIAGAIYILYLAWTILGITIKQNAHFTTSANANAPTFAAGLLVHPLNPKAWVMIVAAYGQFLDAALNWWTQTVIIAAAFFFWQCIAQSLWCFAGAKIAAAVADTKTERWLMATLAVLMIAAVGWSLLR